MKKNRIFIFEFVSGGGFNQSSIPTSLLAEGFGMLRCLIADFKNLNYEIITLLDYRIDYLSKYLKADSTDITYKLDNYLHKFKENLKKSSSCFIIAPEFSSILYNLTKIALDTGVTVLSIGLNGISVGSSKLSTFKWFKAHKLETPATFLIPRSQNRLDLKFLIKMLKKINSPIILKPIDGVGAESIYYFETEDQILEFINKSMEKLDPFRDYIVQEYIKGKDLSVSLIGKNRLNQSSTELPLIAGINHQEISIKKNKSNSKYLGGSTPVKHWKELKRKLERNLKKLDFSDFKGYFGIDFIHKPNSSLNFIEINPRLTTSYIGIRNITDQNILRFIIGNNEEYIEKEDIQFRDFSKFGFYNLKYTGENSVDDLNKHIIPSTVQDIPEIVTPPIHLKSSMFNEPRIFSCYIATHTKDAISSEKKINIIFKKLKVKGFKLK